MKQTLHFNQCVNRCMNKEKAKYIISPRYKKVTCRNCIRILMFLTLTFVGKFAFPLNRYFSQITLTNRIYLYKMSRGNSCCLYLTINTVKPALVTTYKPVFMMSTGSPAQDQLNFVQTSKFFSFYLELYKNKFKNLIQTSKFKFSFRGLLN